MRHSKRAQQCRHANRGSRNADSLVEGLRENENVSNGSTWDNACRFLNGSHRGRIGGRRCCCESIDCSQAPLLPLWQPGGFFGQTRL